MEFRWHHKLSQETALEFVNRLVTEQIFTKSDGWKFQRVVVFVKKPQKFVTQLSHCWPNGRYPTSTNLFSYQGKLKKHLFPESKQLVKECMRKRLTSYVLRNLTQDEKTFYAQTDLLVPEFEEITYE